MAFLARYLSHPQVEIDPEKPVPLWSLSEAGRARAEALAGSGALAGTARIVSSAETKAVETAQILADGLGIPVQIREAMHENDRSATGFLPPAEFEQMADRFFANPEESVRGWERAIDAQRRIVREVDACLASVADGDFLFVGHGGVGTLLYCKLAGVTIDRRYDQGPGGGGNVYGFEVASRRVLTGWRPMEELYAAPGKL